MTKNKYFGVYLFLLLIIGLCSCVDAVLNIIYPVNASVEENPLARQLLIATNDNLVIFIVVKATGTILVLAFLKFYYYYKMTSAFLVATVLATAQGLFLLYIFLAY